MEETVLAYVLLVGDGNASDMGTKSIPTLTGLFLLESRILLTRPMLY